MSTNNIGILRLIPILAFIFVPIFFALTEGRKTSIDRYGCGFCHVFYLREVRITNHLPYTIQIQCRTSDHSLEPHILHPLKEYSFTFRVNVFWKTSYNCSFKGGRQMERKFEAFYSMYDCNHEKVNYTCKWNVGKLSAKRYSWEKNTWLSYRYQYKL